MSRMGSNISLPSTLMHDQDLTTQIVNNHPTRNQIAQISPLDRPQLLQLSPVNSTTIPLCNSEINGNKYLFY